MPRLLLCLITVSLLSLGGCDAPGTSGEPDPSQLFFATCSGCHGGDATGTDRGPDLTWQAADMSVDEVVDVILDGEGSMDPVDLTSEEAHVVADHLIDVLLACPESVQCGP
jgi:hypothetical protein